MATILTVKATGGDSTTIQGAYNLIPSTYSGDYVIEIDAGTYNEVLNLTGKTGAGTITLQGIKGSPTDVTISANESLTTGNNFAVVYVNSQPNITLQDIYIERTGTISTTDRAYTLRVTTGSSNFTFNRCKLYTLNNDFAIQMGIGSDSRIQNSVISGARIAMGWPTGTPNIEFYNNTFYRTGDESANYACYIAAGTFVMKNTLFLTSAGTPQAYFLGTPDASSSHNLYYAYGQSNTNRDTGTGTTEEDPLLTNPSGGDFTLTASSPAIDTGTSISGIVSDFTYGGRPVNTIYDRGAYEDGSVFIDESGGSEGSPLLCWQLTAQYDNGRMYSLTGPGKYPSNINLPKNIIKETITVIEDGKKLM